MSLPVYQPVQCETEFGAARRVGIPHRIYRAKACYVDGELACHHMTWLCGSSSIDAVFVDDPAPYGGVCERCDAVFLGAIIYRCYDEADQLLYIGSTNRWYAREAFHQTRSPWWPEVARVDKSPQPNLPVARRAERLAIRAEAPLYNKQHNVQRFRLDGHAYVPVEAAA